MDGVNKRIQVYTGDGVYLSQWRASGADFDIPRAVAVDAGGHVYVSDQNNYRVQMFTSSGAYLGQWGTRGASDGQFNGPTGVAVGSNGNVFVVDTGNDRIQVFGDPATKATTSSWGR